MRKVILVLCSFALVPAAVTAQQDRHFQTPTIAAVARHSTFLHGYLHGYEEGFHQGDFDLQMGRIEHGDSTRNAAPKGYQQQFGSKKMYTAGYAQGFAVGYDDAAGGRRFRAFDNVMRAASAEPVAPGYGFDEGLQQGYAAGQHQGLSDARSDLQAKMEASPACPVKSQKAAEDFCAAFASGYRIGYADGFTNQARTTTVAER